MVFDEKEFFRIFSAKLSSNYPGTSIGVEYIVMRAWLENISKGTELTCKEYIEQELKKFPPDADYSEYSHVYDIAEEDIPRIVNSAALVSIVALFENGMSRLLYFCSKQERVNYKLKQRMSLIDKYQDFLISTLKIGYKFDDGFISMAKDIVNIRNVCAHGSALIFTFSSIEKTDFEMTLERNIFEIVSRSSGQLSFTGGQLIVSTSYLQNCFEIFDQQTKSLRDYIEVHYFKKVSKDVM